MKTVVGPHPFLRDLRETREAGGVGLEFDESYSPTHKAFRSMAEDQAFDICEMALTTYVQARAKGQPITFLPVSLVGRFQHPFLFARRGDAGRDPKTLEGQNVGVRSYSQTTGVWVRSILRDQFDVDLGNVQWRVTESPHVRGFNLPDNVFDADDDDLVAQLVSGRLDATIGVKNPEFTEPFFADPEARAREWHDEHGIVSVNHGLTVRTELLDRAAPEVRAVYEAFAAAVAGREGGASPHPDWSWTDDVDVLPIGADLLAPLQFIADEAHRQGLVPAPLALDDLVDPRVREWL